MPAHTVPWGHVHGLSPGLMGLNMCSFFPCIFRFASLMRSMCSMWKDKTRKHGENVCSPAPGFATASPVKQYTVEVLANKGIGRKEPQQHRPLKPGCEDVVFPALHHVSLLRIIVRISMPAIFFSLALIPSLAGSPNIYLWAQTKWEILIVVFWLGCRDEESHTLSTNAALHPLSRES